MERRERLNRVEKEIKRKEALAREAKSKGMHSTYSTYLLDIVLLKKELQSLRTDPKKAFVY